MKMLKSIRSEVFQEHGKRLVFWAVLKKTGSRPGGQLCAWLIISVQSECWLYFGLGKRVSSTSDLIYRMSEFICRDARNSLAKFIHLEEHDRAIKSCRH